MTRLFFSAILVLGLSAVRGQESPCPGTFEYKIDGSGIYGAIQLRSTEYVNMVQIRANFTIATRLPTNYVGRIEPVGNSAHILQDFNQGAPLDYRVDFPVTSPLPRLTSLVVNDNALCYGPADIPSPTKYVTTTSLQHSLFLKGQSGPALFNVFERPKPKPVTDFDIFDLFPNEDSQLFTFGDNNSNMQNKWTSDDVNRQSSWNSIIFEVPLTQPPRSSDPPNYPEIITQPPLPPVRRPQETLQPVQPSKPTTPPSAIQCGVVSGGNERQPLVFNGQSYPRGDWPWLVALYKRKDGSLTFICSGTLISDRHVLSAAHCIQQRNEITSNRDIVVKIGVYDLEDWGDDISVTRNLASATIHESFNASSLANDIMVMTLDRSVEFNTNIRPACLWGGNADQSRIVGASGVVAGWGQSESGPAGRGEPKVVRIPVVSTAVCRASRPDFHKLTSPNTICAGDRKGSGPCLGDSGAGMYLLERGRWRVRGVVSLSLRPQNGDSTCNLNEYIVFTDSAQYYDWIQSVMAA